jgi:hypothetical protein
MRRAKQVAWTVVAACAASTSSFAQGIAIDHKPVGCIVAGKYPRLPACFAPAGKLARSRVYFRAESGGANWFYVEMKSDAPCFTGVLPKPKKDLIGKKVFYYIDAFDQQFVENRTPDNAAEVVGSERECKKDVPVAPFLDKASVTVFPSLPAGFAAGGLGGGAVAAIVVGGAAVVGGGVALASNSGSSDTTTTTTSGSAVLPPTVTIPPITGTTTTTLPPVGTEFIPDFRINPNPATGTGSLTVEFNMCHSQGTNLRFTFDFNGDGVEDFRGQCRVLRTFTVDTITALAPPPTGTLPRTVIYNTVMTVFEQPDNPRPPTNTASQTNPVTITEATGAFPFRLTSRSGGPAPIVVRRLAWASQLDVAGATGQVVVNSATAVFAAGGRSTAMALGLRGENRIEAQLVQGSGQSGTWRFELGSTASLEPGSLRVVAGNVALVSGDAVVFRLSGRPGERVVFTFRTGN